MTFMIVTPSERPIASIVESSPDSVAVSLGQNECLKHVLEADMSIRAGWLGKAFIMALHPNWMYSAEAKAASPDILVC